MTGPSLKTSEAGLRRAIKRSVVGGPWYNDDNAGPAAERSDVGRL